MMTDALMIYDCSTDEMRPATQDDVDSLLSSLNKVARLPEYKIPSGVDPEFKFRLAVYPNPMRDGFAFVAEPKEIKPYPGARTLDGRPVYPRMPDGVNCLPMSIPREFADEIVRRWNQFSPS